MATSRHAELSLRDVPYTDPLETIKLGSRLISSKVGIIRALGTGVARAQNTVSLALGALAPDFSNLAVFDHHCTTYTKQPELVAPALAFCDAVTEEVAFSEIPNRSTGRVPGDIELCIEMLKQAGKEVIVVDITTPDIRDVGLHVVRVLIPGLVPLHGNHSFQSHGAPRLHEIPYVMGWDKQGWSPEAGLNRMPHPFP